MKKEEVKSQPAQYTKDEYDALRAGMKNYVDEMRGKHLFTAFNQFLESKNIISFSEEYGIAVINPLQYTRFNDMRAKIANYDDAQLKEVLESMPEEKAAWRKKIDALFKDWREAHVKMKAL